MNQVPALIAHRGDLNRFPENSLEGITAALEAGAPYIEFDVQLCADEISVVIHDANLKRTAWVDLVYLSTK